MRGVFFVVYTQAFRRVGGIIGLFILDYRMTLMVLLFIPARAILDMETFTNINASNIHVAIIPGFFGIFSIRADSSGYATLNQTIAAIPQKEQNSKLIRPPILNIKPL